MNKNVLLLLLGLSSVPVFAQGQQARPVQQQAAIQGTTAPKGNAKISGVVLDADSKNPVEFATIALINASTGKPIDGTMADEKGRFTINKVGAGKYKLLVSFIGYQQKTLSEFAITSDNQDLDMGSITLASDAKRLDEVVITGEKPLVEEKIDRTVYNAEKDLTNAGGNAADVLQKVPSLSLDTDGNVQLRGSSNVRVLINNKPSAIMAGSIADALKQIPADQIKSVEVITAPSAKYDAEGTAGIINIITKKDGGLQGVTGSVALTAGTRASNGNASLNVRRGKLGINANLGAHSFYNKGDMSNITILPKNNTPSDDRYIRNQLGDTRINGTFMNAQFGFDYDFTPKNTLSGSVRSNGGRFNMENNQDQVVTEGGIIDPVDTYETDINNRNERMGTDYNLDFVHTFAKPQQELAILSQYSVTDADTRNHQDRFYTDDAPFYLQRDNNDGGNKELTFQADYVHPFANKHMLEIGAKSIFRDVTSDALYYSIDKGVETDGESTFDYGQNVYASYLTYGFAIQKKLNVKLGARFEQTVITADFTEVDDTGTKRNTPHSDDYHNLIPSVALSYTLKDKHTLKANYTQRIQRPSLFYLNPYIQNQAPGTKVIGNPFLDAELTNLFELGYSTYFKTSSISTSLYMRQTDNAIETIPGLDDDNSTILKFANVAQNKTYGISLFGSVKPVNAWTIGGSSNIYYVNLKSTEYSNNGWMYNINANSSYNFGKGLSAQFNGGFNSKRIQLQGNSASFSYHSLAFKKDLFGGKGGLSLGLDNPFRKSMKMEIDVNANAYEQHIRINNYNRGAKVTFNYSFGKMDQQRPPKRKKSIRNDDAKQGDGNGIQ
jgi:outer membrane receptor protein involved in Fe transport